MTLSDLRSTIKAQLATWQAEIKRQKQPGCTVLSGQPFIVYCEGGLGLRLNGNASIPTPCTPGLCGISHFTAEDARDVARLRGAPYRVVAASDVPRLRVHELLELWASLQERASSTLEGLLADCVASARASGFDGEAAEYVFTGADLLNVTSRFGRKPTLGEWREAGLRYVYGFHATTTLDVRSLRAEALADGNVGLVAICDHALAGDEVAMVECSMRIAAEE